jgi:Tfp pilus assembly protein PilP
MRPLAVITLVALIASAVAAAPPQAPPPEGPPAPPPNYVYEPDGRRDPFVSLVNRGTESGSASVRTRPDGLRGVLVDEVVVKGIVQSRDGWVAMIGAPSGRTFTVRSGDRLLDGAIQAITSEAVVLLQEVDNPLSIAKHREVRKYMRSGDGR